ncbi:hypothetical protein ASD88_25015 [Pelomonas sp. Root662]|nr:hypothetical protein ASC81_25060 [Pelomonas sp. Root405]KRA76447.1 hypothetical protein ASD88_25015 [Pelomonas sp. Root662]
MEVAGRKGEVSQWVRAESQHFVVYSDAREEDVSQLLDNLEKLDHLLRIYTLPGYQTTQRVDQQDAKLTLYHHRGAADLLDIDASGPADAIGLYSSCTAGVQGFGVQLDRIPTLGDEQLDKAPLNETLSHVFEAYARHFLYRHTDIRSPAWFIEGFAQYFSSVRFSEGQMVVGRTPKAIASYLHFLGEGRRYSLEYDDVLLHKLADARNYAGPAGVRLEFEAKSWLLMHYALASEDRRRRLSQHLALAGRGVAPTTAFERAFDLKTSDISQVMWRYGLRGTETLRVAHPSLPAARVSFRNLPRATGEFVLADAALKSCPSRQAGEALLRKVTALAARFPNEDAARLTLSRAQIDWGDPQDALPRLNALLQVDDEHFEARYLLGLANLRLAERHGGEARRSFLQAAQRHLELARGLKPQSPQAAFAHVQADVAATAEPDGAAVEAAISAGQSAREVNALARFAALAHAYAGHADEAHRTLASLAQDLRDEPTARWARQWQSRLETGVTRGAILAEMRRSPAPETSSKEWTIDKESVMQQVARAHGMEAAEPLLKTLQEQQDRTQQPASSMGGNAEKR